MMRIALTAAALIACAGCTYVGDKQMDCSVPGMAAPIRAKMVNVFITRHGARITDLSGRMYEFGPGAAVSCAEVMGVGQ